MLYHGWSFLFFLLFDYYAMKIKCVQYTSTLGILANFLIIIENAIIKNIDKYYKSHKLPI